MSVVAAVEFKYSESHLADQLGLSRTDLKFLRDRHLKVDRDWKKLRGEVLLSAGGLRILWREIGEPRRRAIDLGSVVVESVVFKKNGAATNGVVPVASPIALGDVKMPIPRKMRVTAIPLNPQVVNAVDEYNARTLIWVGRNENFVVGDQLDVIPHQLQPGFWRFTGRLPRDRRRVGGKWF